MKTNTDNKQQSLFLYSLVFYLLGLPVVLYTLWLSIKFGDRNYFFQRLGFSCPRSNRKTVWLHVASVGEAIAVQPLVESLLENTPEYDVMVTTFTVTGANIIREKFPEKVRHVYLPLDFPGAIARFLKSTRPACALIMETEIWPNLYAACEKQHIPLVLFNARLSSRTLETGRWMRNIYITVLDKVAVVLARSGHDKARFIQLGVNEDKIKVVGNIKFAFKPSDPVKTFVQQISRPYVLAASTRKDEEKIIVQAWMSIPDNNHLLVIAPRHPHRLNEILSQLDNLDVNVAVRSRDDTVTDSTQVYIADTLGELALFMPHAEFVFMGGSLVPLGGHNIIEPANYGKAILFGSYMENFLEEARLFLENDAAIQLQDNNKLAQVFSDLINDTDKQLALGNNAKALVSQYQNVTQDYMKEFRRVCD